MSQLDDYTPSLGRYLRHGEQLAAYRMGTGRTAITADISPTGACGQECDYCLVGHRDRDATIPLVVVKDFICSLMDRGLGSVVLCGGGEPTLYPQINELLAWIEAMGLSVGLITNGAALHEITSWSPIKWLRVSLTSAEVPITSMDIPEHVTRGVSFIAREPSLPCERIEALANQLGAQYIRVKPDAQEDDAALEESLRLFVDLLDDPRWFLHSPTHRRPAVSTCPRAYFRPYLSEVDGGTVFPCGVVPLQRKERSFGGRFKLCGPAQVGTFLDGAILPRINPSVDCPRCGSVEIVEALAPIRVVQQHGEFA